MRRGRHKKFANKMCRENLRTEEKCNSSFEMMNLLMGMHIARDGNYFIKILATSVMNTKKMLKTTLTSGASLRREWRKMLNESCNSAEMERNKFPLKLMTTMIIPFSCISSRRKQIKAPLVHPPISSE